MSEMIREILDTLQYTFHQLTNADFSVLMVLAIGVVVVGILILRR